MDRSIDLAVQHIYTRAYLPHQDSCNSCGPGCPVLAAILYQACVEFESSIPENIVLEDRLRNLNKAFEFVLAQITRF